MVGFVFFKSAMKRFIILCVVVLSMIYATVALPEKMGCEPREEELVNNTVKGIPEKAARSFRTSGVIAVTKLTVRFLQTILDILANVERKIAIGVVNQSGGNWTGSGLETSSGTSDGVLPYEVINGKALYFTARKTSGPVSRGAVGVFTYHMSDGNTLAVYYHVPFDYNLYSNKWNIKVYPGKQKATSDMLDEICDDSPLKAQQWHHRDLGYDLRMRGYMTGSGQATLEIHVCNISDRQKCPEVINTGFCPNLANHYHVLFIALLVYLYQ